MNNIYKERWSKDIKSIISCDKIIFKKYKSRIVEIILKLKLFTRDLLMREGKKCRYIRRN